MLDEAGCDVLDLGIVRDDEDELEAVLRDAAARCDAIVTSGGVSMGDYDVVKAVLGRIADMHWMQIAIKPAKPFAFGTIDGTPIFGLPGNPVSSMVSFEMIARPALRSMMGHPSPLRTQLVGVTDVDLRRQVDGKTHLLRVNGAFEDDGRLPRAAGRGAGQSSVGRHRDRRCDRRPARRTRRRRGRRRRRRPPWLGSARPVGWVRGNGEDVQPRIWSIRSAASSRICGSRSPTAATSAAPTACPRRG